MQYNSLHDYLDDVLGSIAKPSQTQIKQAKKDYRKIYTASYYKTYRQAFIQISFRLSKKQFTAFSKLAEEKGIKVTSLIRQGVIQQLKNTSSYNTREFKIFLLQVIDVIEEAIQEKEPVDAEKLLNLMEQMQQKQA